MEETIDEDIPLGLLVNMRPEFCGCSNQCSCAVVGKSVNHVVMTTTKNLDDANLLLRSMARRNRRPGFLV